ncbi:MAG TPA: PGPGW domain-containing protein [Candidatus Sulfotelmatobacter sp.]|nr:PGPGW domain-containing protein [Candidatus Sulfotelmatobacter sp.]
MKSILRGKMKFPVLILGSTLLLLGAIGLVLPLLPGIPLLIAGLVMLSREYDWARRLLARGQRWLPAVLARSRQAWRSARTLRSQRAPHRPQSCVRYRSTENQ